MRRALLVVAVLSGALQCGCADLVSLPASRISGSADYASADDATGVHAFVYGKRTVLAFDRRPLRLTVHDENGVEVAYEREGPYYRMARQLERFTVWMNLRTFTFNRTSRPAFADAMSAPPATSKPTNMASDAAPRRIPVPFHTTPAPDAELSLSQLFTAQQDEVRQLIARHAHSRSEAEALTMRLARIEAQHVEGVSTVIRVQFEDGASAITFDRQGIPALLAAAKAAEQITIEGHTDASIERPADLDVALRRARAAREFLVAQGIDGSKISIAARPAGDVLAPLNSAQGRALNRRAEIELIHRRHEH